MSRRVNRRSILEELGCGLLLVIVTAILVALISWIWPTTTTSDTPTAYRPLPAAEFVPLVRPIRVEPTAKPSPTPGPVTVILPPTIAVKGVAGVATWYAYHRGQAAAAARLRAYLGPNWRGSIVTVCGPHAYLPCISIVLTDYESSKIPGRLIDLDVVDFATLCGDPGRGVCAVTVSGR